MEETLDRMNEQLRRLVIVSIKKHLPRELIDALIEAKDSVYKAAEIAGSYHE